MNGCCELIERLYINDCWQIAQDCKAEGYPARGENYDLRCEELWNSMYREDYERAAEVIH